MYDVVVVGGGTAGAVVAARLSADPSVNVCLIEGGPSDVGDDRVLKLRNWLNLLESELDYDYPIVAQERGNSRIRHARARVLGGCSSHNTMISLLPPPADFADWVAAGGAGWSDEAMRRYWSRLQVHIEPVGKADRNAFTEDFVASAAAALDVPVVADFNAAPFANGAGFLPVGYHPETGIRSSSSLAYLHPNANRPNLTVRTGTWAYRIDVDRHGVATGVRVRDGNGRLETISAAHEYVLCAGAVDTPRLLLLSGIGRADDLRRLGIEPVVDLPGVGEHLLDHPESMILWEASRPLPPNSAMDSDAGLFVNRDGGDRPDLMFHLYQFPFTVNTEPLGFDVPAHGFGMTPNVPRPRSVGRMWLVSADPEVKPALDFRYFTDPDGYDEQTIVDGLRLAREVAATPPFRDWIAREIAPGPDARTDAELSAYGRAAHHTVYHPAGTCAMGPVVDGDLRLRGTSNVRIADASVFPAMTTVNPMVTVLLIGERAADLVAATVAATVAAKVAGKGEPCHGS